MPYSILRTPDERFNNLPDYPFKPNYMTIEDLRIHYIDEGPPGGKVVLLLHGEPSWSYLYRKMIPPLVENDYRVIAPDLIGFGKSDKLVRQKDHSYKLHVSIITKFVETLDLKKANLFIQDWGGLIGMRVVHNMPDRFARIMAANTGFSRARGRKGLFGHLLFKRKIKSMGKVSGKDLSENPGFVNWVAYSQTVDNFQVGNIIQGSTISELSEEEVKAYDAPFPDDSYKAGPRVMPMLVTSQLRTNQKVWDQTFKNWTKPVMTAFSDKDPITRGGHKSFQRDIPGAADIHHHTTENAGHFLQEDKGPELAALLIKFIETTEKMGF
ncbi:MAG: haloalkane dehalogenase [Candidatus Kariarchaeaceae archaeon]|jgi:haloalkane dehalogenase